MKIIDVDALFEKYVRNYITQNAGKFTEEEWEDKVPELYESFGNVPAKELDNKSPVEYYASFSAKQLCDLLKMHIEEEIPVSDYLCEAITAKDTEKHLLDYLKQGADEELMSYAINFLGDLGSVKALQVYVKGVSNKGYDENVRELMGEMLIDNASKIPAELKAAYKKGGLGSNYIVEALVNCPQEDFIFNVLCDEFAATKNLPLFANYFAKYGDERAVEILKARISQPGIKYADFTELKYAIEALGGEYTDERDFTSDVTYKKIKNLKS